MRAICFLSPFLSLTLGCSTLLSQQAKDIIGLTIGMTMEEAKAKIGSQFTVRPLKSQDPLVSFFVAYLPDVSQVWSAKAINNKVVFIEHDQEFANGKAPLKQDVFDSIVKKYGFPSVTRGLEHEPTQAGEFGGSYVFDSSGNPLPWGRYELPRTPGGTARVCRIYAGNAGVIVNAHQIGSFPGMTPLGCHQILQVRAQADSQFVSYLVFSEEDVDAEIKENERLEALKKAQDQKTLGDAKKVKVPM